MQEREATPMMDRKKAIAVIEEIFEIDSLGFLSSFSDEQDEAIRFALYALKHPELIRCGRCETFADEDVNGDGWCYHKDRFATCDDEPCGAFTRRAEDCV